MAQTGFTPIQLYRTTTSGAAPSAADLAPGELAINIANTDMALFAENASGSVVRLMNNPAGLRYPTADGTNGQVVTTNGSGVLSFTSLAAGSVTSVNVSGGTTGLTTSGGPVTSSGTITLAGTLGVANGGTGATTAANALTALGAVAKAGDTMTGVLAVTAGTVSAPGLAASGDSNTGVFFPAADTIAFTEGGVEAMRIDSSGNVGIGTTNPAVRLAVVSTDAMLVPVGTTAQRPTGATGYFRYNSTTNSFEGHNGTAWGSIGGSSGPSYTVRNSNYSAVAGDYILADTSSASFTITLPASPITGSVIYIADSQGTFLTRPLTVARNGNTIMRRAEDLRASTNGAEFGLVYNGSDWRII